MNNKNSVLYYSSGSKFFHWVIALIVIGMLSGSFFLDDIPKQYAGMAYMIHKSLGVSILALMILRLLWIFHAGRPPLPVLVPAWEKLLSRVVQYSLYFFVILMPICGWIMSVAAGRVPTFFGLFSLPLPGIPLDENLSKLMNQSHKTIAWIIIVLLVLHTAGALKHHFIDKDTVLKAMLPKRLKD